MSCLYCRLAHRNVSALKRSSQLVRSQRILTRKFTTNPSLAGTLSTSKFLSPTQILNDVQIGSEALNASLTDLGFSYWPSGLAARCLEYLHADIGLPYWLAIVTCGVAVRMLLWYPLIRQQRFMGVLQERTTTMQEIEYELNLAKYNHRDNAAQKLSYELQYHKDKYGQSVKNMVPFWLAQWICFVSVYGGIRNCNELLPTFKTGGLFWSPNLALADVTGLWLPVISASCVFISFYATSFVGNASSINALGLQSKDETQGVFPKISWQLIGISTAAGVLSWSGWVSSAINIYMLSTLNVTLLQNVVLQIPAVKERANIQKYKSRRPYYLTYGIEDELEDDKSWLDRLKSWWKVMRSSFEDQARKQGMSRQKASEEDEYYKKWKAAGTGPIPITYSSNPLLK